MQILPASSRRFVCRFVLISYSLLSSSISITISFLYHPSLLLLTLPPFPSSLPFLLTVPPFTSSPSFVLTIPPTPLSHFAHFSCTFTLSLHFPHFSLFETLNKDTHSSLLSHSYFRILYRRVLFSFREEITFLVAER